MSETTIGGHTYDQWLDTNIGNLHLCAGDRVVRGHIEAWRDLLDHAFGRLPAKPFKRASDPQGCGYRSGGDCASLGGSLHCRLEAGHQPLGHDWKGDAAGRCSHWYSQGIPRPCAEGEAAHGRPHAMEVSGPYVLQQLKKAGRG